MTDIQAKPVHLQKRAPNHYAGLPQVDGNGMAIHVYVFLAGYRLRNFVCIYQKSWQLFLSLFQYPDLEESVLKKCYFFPQDFINLLDGETQL